MKKVLLSVLSVGVVASVAVFATQAYFSDQEKSNGNTFTAGSLDLKVSNTCHLFQGTDVDSCPTNLSWTESDLGQGKVFFNFTDLKPGDYGESTIDFKV